MVTLTITTNSLRDKYISAFNDLTKNMNDWKEPINTFIITHKSLEHYQEACEFFTGSKLEVVSFCKSRNGYYVQSDGYYHAMNPEI